MSTEFFGRFPVVFEKIGDVFGMFRQNSAILCAPLRASETPHFRALSTLMRVALCAVRRKRFSTNEFQFAIERRKGDSNWSP